MGLTELVDRLLRLPVLYRNRVKSLMNNSIELALTSSKLEEIKGIVLQDGLVSGKIDGRNSETRQAGLVSLLSEYPKIEELESKIIGLKANMEFDRSIMRSLEMEKEILISITAIKQNIESDGGKLI